ncbi:HES6 protein, partial [Amia calva]|nr:HES6 protein [Amia calva]
QLRKPLIEKRRRERINSSLEQLKGIMVDAYNLDQSKLEKADVLEITVQHMEALTKSHSTGGGKQGLESRQRYSSGYIQCMHEVHNLLLSCPGLDKNMGARLLNHLLKSLPQTVGEPGAAAGPTHPGPGPSSGLNSSLPLPAAPSPVPAATPVYQPLSVHLPASCARSPSPQISPIALYRSSDEGSSSSSPSPPPPSSPSISPQGAPSPGLQLYPGVDPSMWRPW